MTFDRFLFCTLIGLFLIVPAFQTVSAQYLQINSSSLDVVVDPAAISMGESFTAKRGSLNAMGANPAGIAAIGGPAVFYGFRNFDYNPGYQAQYSSLKGAIPFSFGTFGISYTRFQSAEMVYTSPAYPEGFGTVIPYDYTLGVTFARSFGPHWDGGIAVKRFDSGEEINVIAYPVQYSTTAPALLDAGVLYHSEMTAADNGAVFSAYSIGGSFQNFGTDYRISQTYASANGLRSEIYQPLPRYFRFGISYSFAVLPQAEGDARTFMFNFTGDYRNVLNQPEAASSLRDYWGFGIETWFYELVALRAGGYVPGTNNIYGNKGVPSIRYGGGLRLPFKRIGISSPFALQLDYAAIPVNVSNYYYLLQAPNTTMRSYSLTLQYDGKLFNGSN